MSCVTVDVLVVVVALGGDAAGVALVVVVHLRLDVFHHLGSAGAVAGICWCGPY